MGSLPPEQYISSHEGQNFVVKLENNPFDESLLRTSSEEDFGDFTDPPNVLDGQSTALYPPDSSLFQVVKPPPPGQMGAIPAEHTVSGGNEHGSRDTIPISKRTLQNRKAQREFRQRRATYLKDLEAKVKRFEGDPALAQPEMFAKIQHLLQENQYLRAIIERLQTENAEFRKLDPHYSGHSNLGLTGPCQYVQDASYPTHPRNGSALGSSTLSSIDAHGHVPYYHYEPTRTHSDPQNTSSAHLPNHSLSAPRQSVHPAPSSSSPIHRTVYAAPASSHMEWASVKKTSLDQHRPQSTRSEGDRLEVVHEARSTSGSRTNDNDYLHPQGQTPIFYRTTHDVSTLLPHHEAVSSASSSHTSATGSLYGQYHSTTPNPLIDTRTTTPQRGISDPEGSLLWGAGGHVTTYSPTTFNLPRSALPFAADTTNHRPYITDVHQHHANDRPRSNTHSPTGQ